MIVATMAHTEFNWWHPEMFFITGVLLVTTFTSDTTAFLVMLMMAGYLFFASAFYLYKIVKELSDFTGIPILSVKR